MMFIDITRYGGLRVMRLASAAIAYLDDCDGGCAVHLVGGETLRVNEDTATIEARLSGGTDPVAASTVVQAPVQRRGRRKA